MAPTVILDVDTGVDDALAILYATRHPDVSVLGITCVDGNTNLAQVCHNTLQVLDAAGAAPIPVAAGAATPLMGPVGDSSHVHGDDGLAGLAHHNTQRQLDPRHAIELIRDLVEESREPVTLGPPSGPLTNIALFLSYFPATADKSATNRAEWGGSASGERHRDRRIQRVARPRGRPHRFLQRHSPDHVWTRRFQRPHDGSIGGGRAPRGRDPSLNPWRGYHGLPSQLTRWRDDLG